MIQPIMHDPLFLAQMSAPATPEDAPVARDLLETLTAHADGCVGMAANMIGVLKRIIAVEAEDGYLVLFNPVILKKSGQYEAEEGCLSLEGVRKTKRYQSIKVQYQTMDGKPRIKTFTGWKACGKQSAGRASRCSIRPWTANPASRPLPAGRRRSSSTRSTIATEY